MWLLAGRYWQGFVSRYAIVDLESSVSLSQHVSRLFQVWKTLSTIFIPDERFVDNVLIIDIKIELKVVHIQLKNVNCWDETVVVGGRT
jgi:hypothetical protein